MNYKIESLKIDTQNVRMLEILSLIGLNFNFILFLFFDIVLLLLMKNNFKLNSIRLRLYEYN